MSVHGIETPLLVVGMDICLGSAVDLSAFTTQSWEGTRPRHPFPSHRWGQLPVLDGILSGMRMSDADLPAGNYVSLPSESLAGDRFSAEETRGLDARERLILRIIDGALADAARRTAWRRLALFLPAQTPTRSWCAVGASRWRGSNGPAGTDVAGNAGPRSRHASSRRAPWPLAGGVVPAEPVGPGGAGVGPTMLRRRGLSALAEASRLIGDGVVEVAVIAAAEWMGEPERVSARRTCRPPSADTPWAEGAGDLVVARADGQVPACGYAVLAALATLSAPCF